MSRSPSDRATQREMERRSKQKEKEARAWSRKAARSAERRFGFTLVGDPDPEPDPESYAGIDRGVCEYDPRTNPHPNCRCAIHAWTEHYQNPDYRWFHEVVVRTPTMLRDPLQEIDAANRGVELFGFAERRVSHELKITGVLTSRKAGERFFPEQPMSLWCENCQLPIQRVFVPVLPSDDVRWTDQTVWFGFDRPRARSPEGSAEMRAHRVYDLQTQRFTSTLRWIECESALSIAYRRKPAQMERRVDWTQALGWSVFSVAAMRSVLDDKDARDEWWIAMTIWLDEWERKYG